MGWMHTAAAVTAEEEKCTEPEAESVATAAALLRLLTLARMQKQHTTDSINHEYCFRLKRLATEFDDTILTGLLLPL